jgi:hypothetical protein
VVAAVRATESVTVLRGLGLQLEQRTVWGRVRARAFLPFSSIRAVVINEAIEHFRVVTYLALLLRRRRQRGRRDDDDDDDDSPVEIVLPFRCLRGRQEMLVAVYRDIHAQLAGSATARS